MKPGKSTYSRPSPDQFHAWESRARGGKEIAVIGLPVLDMVASPIKMALARRAVQENWRIILAAEATIGAYRLLRQTKCDGALVRVISGSMASIARRLPFPVVNISSMLEQPGVSTVCRDDRNLGRICAKHLLERGFTRFGIIEHPARGWCFHEREKGFVEVVRQTSPRATIKVHKLQSLPIDTEGERHLKAWLVELGRPAGLFLCDDPYAPTLLKLCRAANFKVPTDFAVISATGHTDVLRDCSPTLTHGAEDGEVIINEACEYLARLMHRPENAVRMIKMPAAEIVPGFSTDATCVDNLEVARAIDFIDAFYRKPIQVADVVTHVNRSRRWLERAFFEAKKVTLHRYLTERRLQEAQRKLKAAPGVSLDAVAKQAGFGNLATFHRSFTAATGMSPNTWRRHNQLS